MKNKLIALIFMVLTFGQAWSKDVTVLSQSSEAADGLDLMAVSELFKETPNLEEFEKSLNDPNIGINNLDLDNNGYVDFIRVVEDAVEDTRIIILQAALGEDEFQDVATIEVEKSGNDYNLQVRGNVIVYGPDYYIAPSVVRIATWPILGWIYRPVYRPYRSTFYFGYYPRWWKPFRPVHINVYRTRTVTFTKRNTFVVTKTNRVKTVNKVTYKPSNSSKVTRTVGVKKTTTNGKTTTAVGVKKTRTTANGNTVTTKKGVKRTNNKNTGTTTTTKGVKKTKTNKDGSKTKVKKTKKVKKKD
ncbi:MAG TPA: hypothetical protein PK055_08155 [Gammaproteobacteria bacterium]|nr:hypothetical protein [Xanthomonadales bacterium]MCB1594192.1 hypothetical protein [Xanthomonadales bacterium]HOP22502.1 hypothetical protein [Gammaproteobacteria bacterium]HPI96162.1 hypothetical protein [Gammaproteobacteria bacterium]HPQ87616.1 hypothetical protein [Gammaproteobacteria bacterium]